jgi:phosphatidylglycerol lysyltransferase
VVEGFSAFKAEGIMQGSMGLASLSKVLDGEGKGSTDAWFLNLVYEHLNRFYGFKNLRQAKEKYGPTDWTAEYFVYTGKHLSPQLAYAAVAIQSPVGLKGFAKSLLPQKKAEE